MENKYEYHGSIQLRETNTVNRLSGASLWVRLKQLFSTLVAGAIIGGIIFIVGYLSQWNWLMYTGYGIAGLIGLFGLYSSFSAKVSQCPYCNNPVGKGAYDAISSNNEHLQIECPSCNEWLISHEGEIRAYTNLDAEEEEKFEAPVLQNMVWPNECMACGRETEHYQDIKKNKLNAAQLLVGRISVSMAKVPNVPYCGYHRDEISLKISNEEVRFVFPDYQMQRRYLEVNDRNRGKILKT